jgi:hypothetical protein
MQQVLERLEGALNEVKALREENRIIKSASRNLSQPNQHAEVDEPHPVLPRPLDRLANVSDLYSKQHEV